MTDEEREHQQLNELSKAQEQSDREELRQWAQDTWASRKSSIPTERALQVAESFLSAPEIEALRIAYQMGEAWGAVAKALYMEHEEAKQYTLRILEKCAGE